jgi:hypothetical protein
METNGVRPLLPYVPQRQRGPLMNLFLEPVRRGITTDPDVIVTYVIATLREDIQRRGTWNFSSDLTPLHQTLLAVQGHPTEARALAAEAVAYERMPERDRAKLRASRRNDMLRQYVATKPTSMLSKPPSEKQLEYLRKLGVATAPANRWDASQLIDAALRKGARHV